VKPRALQWIAAGAACVVRGSGSLPGWIIRSVWF